MKAGLSLLAVALIVASMPHACGEKGDEAAAGAGGSAANGTMTGGTGGSAAKAGSSGDGGSAGTSTQGQWNPVEPSGLPGCGAGCRTLTGHLRHPGYYGFFSHPTGFATTLSYESVTANVFEGGLLYSGAAAEKVQALATPKGLARLHPTLSEKHIAVIQTEGTQKGTVELIDRATGESRTVAKYNQKTDHPELPVDYGVSATAINSKYVFWLREGEGWYRQNLKTGDTKLLLPAGFGCDTLHPTEDGILCGNTNGFKAMLIDQETGEKKLLSPNSKPIQEDAAFSPSGQYAVWVDYRDPPGEASTDAFRNGGEIYLHDRKAGTTKRMTFDSPGAPRGKTRPAVGDSADTLVWLETCKTCEANPSGMDNLYYLTTTVVRLDVASGKKCRLPDDGIHSRGARSTLFGRKWYHYVVIAPPGEIGTGPYLGALDLDDPVVPWECD